MQNKLRTLIALLCLDLGGGAAAAQEGPVATAPDRFAPLVTLGSLAETRLRDDQLLGTRPADGFLVRSPLLLTPALSGEGFRWQILAPRFDAVWNSEIPFTFNDATLWAGRGWSFAAQAGARVRWGPVSVVLAPEMVYMQNRDTPVLPPDPAFPTDRSDFASPWHSGAYGTADLPLRFGNRPIAIIAPGQSSLALSLGSVAAGATTENEWWGPGIRNSIVMSSNAPGFPRAFLSTTRPVATPLGGLHARWITGILTESLYFDDRADNDHRSLSGFALTLQPAFEPNLTLGIGRSVIAPLSAPEDAWRHVAHAFTEAWDAPEPGDTSESIHRLGSDQLLSLFGRWLLPRDGLEVYGEWGWSEVPRGIRDLLTLPSHARGYTVGLQYLGGSKADPNLRVQIEATSLERSAAGRQRPSPTFYLGRSTDHGYTHRGQVIGAAVGPGGSSQWLAVDHFFDAGSRSLGLAGGRVRWENDTFYTRGLVTRYDHDVSVFAGPRITAGTRWGSVQAEALLSHRFNYLFQRRQSDPVQPRPAIDVTNLSFRFSLVPG